MPPQITSNWGRARPSRGLPEILQFGAVLYEVRTRVHCTQTQIAEQIGVSKTYICAIENSRYTPPSESLINAIADALGATEEEKKTLLEVAAMERLLLAMPSRLSADLTSEVHHAVIRASKRLEDARVSDKGEQTM